MTRRDWMLAAACWADVLKAQTPPGQRFAWFDPPAAAEIEAIAACIIPDDDTAGARQAEVIRFIDGALAGYDADKRDVYTRGLASAQAQRAVMFPSSSSIASLTREQQVALLKSIETTEFFRLVRFHTVLGFFGHPMHGGNKDMAGWKLIGIEHSMRYAPPFGYYDGEAGAGDDKASGAR